MMRRVPMPVAVLVAVLVAGSLLGWRYQHLRSPQHSLQELRDSIADQNRLRFERYVDVELLAASTIDEVLAKATLKSVLESTSGLGVLGSLVAAQSLDRLGPALAQELRTTLLRSVENGRLHDAVGPSLGPDDAADHQLNLTSVAVNTAFDQMRFEGLGEIRRDGDRATVGLHFRNEVLDTTLVLRLRMERNDKRWKITRPDNLTDYLDDIQVLQERHLAEQNRLMRERVDVALRVGSLQRTPGRGTLQGLFILTAEVENIGTHPLDRIVLKTTRAGKEVHSTGRLVLVESLAPGEKGEAFGLLDYNRFDPDHVILRFNNDLTVEVIALDVVHEDQSREILREYPSWANFVRRRPQIDVEVEAPETPDAGGAVGGLALIAAP